MVGGAGGSAPDLPCPTSPRSPPGTTRAAQRDASALSPGGAAQLTRSTSDRVIGGVAGGLGRYFNIDPLAIRITFVILAFAGAFGVDRLPGLPALRPDRRPGCAAAPGLRPDRSAWPARRSPRASSCAARLLGAGDAVLAVAGAAHLHADPGGPRRRRAAARAGRRRRSRSGSRCVALAVGGFVGRGRGHRARRRDHRGRARRSRAASAWSAARSAAARAGWSSPRSCSRCRSAPSPRPTSTCAEPGVSARFVPQALPSWQTATRWGRER